MSSDLPRLGQLAVAVAVAVLAACTPEPREVYPQISVHVTNLWADEGEACSVRIGADRSFVRTQRWSDGAANFETVCRGTLPAELVDPWLRRVEAAATSAASIDHLIREAQAEDQPHYEVTVGWATAAGSTTYADPQQWADELPEWIASLASFEARCEPDREL